MKKFDFRFESVLKFRKSKEDRALSLLAVEQQRLQSEAGKKVDLERSLQKGLTRREALGSKPVTIGDFHAEENFIQGTKKKIKQAEIAITRANRSVEKSLKHYLFCRRQSRTMELVKENDEMEFKKRREKLEQKAVDEMVVMRYRTPEDTQ